MFDKKEKKKQILQRNKRNQIIIQHAEQHQAELEAARKAEEALREARAHTEPQEEVVWSAKTQEIRNIITSKRRASKERWNRFAGTASAGARGL